MTVQWRGIERRLERLDDCVNKLDALRQRSRQAFDDDTFLRYIAERNLALIIVSPTRRIHTREALGS